MEHWRWIRGVGASKIRGKMNQKILRILIPVLTLADGALHLALDFVLFRGNLFGNPFAGGPPPGAPPPGTPPRDGGGPPPLPLPLNQLFLLNFIGAMILAALFWFAPRWLGKKSWWVNIALIAYEATTFAGWWLLGAPNPLNLGYLSKSIEVVLIVALVAGIWQALRPRKSISQAP